LVVAVPVLLRPRLQDALVHLRVQLHTPDPAREPARLQLPLR
jgi:hypothetical protein